MEVQLRGPARERRGEGKGREGGREQGERLSGGSENVGISGVT